MLQYHHRHGLFQTKNSICKSDPLFIVKLEIESHLKVGMGVALLIYNAINIGEVYK